MDKAAEKKNYFIGYEYRDVTVSQDIEALYTDGYENFGWKLESISPPQIGVNSLTIKFKRDRKLRNKAELTRLQRQFDACIGEIASMEKSKSAKASIIAVAIGLVGTAFMAGATFAYLAGLIILCIVLALPAFIGWIIPYFVYNHAYAKNTGKLTPLIEAKYDEAYEICEKANALL